MKEISLSEYVMRAHTVPFVKEQSLASHMGRSVMILIRLYRGGLIKISEQDYYRVLEMLAIHDLHEVEFGDIPYTTKERFGMKFGELVEELELLQKFGLKMLPLKLQIVKDFVDLFEFYLKCVEEERFGNSFPKLREVKVRAFDIMRTIVELHPDLFDRKILKILEEVGDGESES
jgi:5'-deoxynucleotidase YfbR-like HD superfamily hydrolase